MTADSSKIILRRAELSDLETLVQLRVAFFREIRDVQNEKTFKNAVKEYYTATLPKEEFIGFIAEVNGQIIATSGLVFLQKPPKISNLSGKEAYIMNMYTLPEWRKKGIGTKLLKETIKLVQKMGISVIRLHAEPDAISLYERNGFVPVSIKEMELIV